MPQKTKNSQVLCNQKISVKLFLNSHKFTTKSESFFKKTFEKSFKSTPQKGGLLKFARVKGVFASLVRRRGPSQLSWAASNAHQHLPTLAVKFSY